jgi:hypothetical protein
VKPTEADLDRELRLATAMADMTASAESLELRSGEDETSNPTVSLPEEHHSKGDNPFETPYLEPSLGEHASEIQASNNTLSASTGESNAEEARKQGLEVQKAVSDTRPDDVD